MNGFGWPRKQMITEFRKSKLRVSVIREVSWKELSLCCALKMTDGVPGCGIGSEDDDPYRADGPCGE